MTDKEEYQKALDELKYHFENPTKHYWNMGANEPHKYFDKLQELIDSQTQPTFEECIKEWEKRGFVVHNKDKYIVIETPNKYYSLIISKRDLTYSIDFWVNMELNTLLAKTIKALEVMKDD